MPSHVRIFEIPDSLQQQFDIEKSVKSILNYLHKHHAAIFPSENISVSIEFVSLAKSRQLKHMFLGIDEPTNVLAFPSGESEAIGDIALCFPVILQQANEQEISAAIHCIHMVTHALLHLLGFSHDFDEERTKMEQIESEIMIHLNHADPWIEQ